MAANKQYILNVLIGGSTLPSYNASLKRAGTGMNQLGSIARKVALGITTAFAAINIKDAIEDAVKTYAEFEQAMANTAGISGATTIEYERMEEAARQAGATTTKTATEAADALSYMALA